MWVEWFERLLVSPTHMTETKQKSRECSVHPVAFVTHLCCEGHHCCVCVRSVPVLANRQMVQLYLPVSRLSYPAVMAVHTVQDWLCERMSMSDFAVIDKYFMCSQATIYWMWPHCVCVLHTLAGDCGRSFRSWVVVNLLAEDRPTLISSVHAHS